MAVVKFSRKEFEKYVKISKDVEEKIALFGTPLESLSADEVEIEIFPNRPDLLSMQGYLRSFLAFLAKKTGIREYKINSPEKDFEINIDKSVRDVRPFTACAIVKGIKFDDEKIKEVIDIQEKIHNTLGRNRKKIAIGVYPLEKIQLPIKYKARKPEEIKFIPLESNKEMNGMQILRQHPTGRDYAHLLAGKDKFPVFVDSANEILSMPPIINSEKTGKIDENTKEVFIECSGFNFDILKKTLNILVTMLADMGGKVYEMKLNYAKSEVTPDLTPEKMKINIENANKLLGVNLSEKDVKRFLERMGYNYGGGVVEVPAWRTDILHEVDIIEDIGIAYGYDNFVPEIPEIFTIGEEDKNEVLKRKISNILSGLKLQEVSSYHLLMKDDLKKIGEKGWIEVEKSKTDYKFLRKNLFASILKVLSENIDSEYPQKIFEIGKVFELGGGETGVLERDNLAVAITPGNFTEIKQILEYLGKMLDVEIKIEAVEKEGFIDGRVGEIIAGGVAGVVGEVHPSVLKSWHLKMPLVYLEIDLDKIFEKLT